MATFTRYQKFVVAVLAFLQFTTVLDFMILSPLGAILLEKLGITTRQFGLVVSAYAFSAGIAGVLTAGFADKFDRKRLLLFFYSGFVLGTLLCALANSFQFLLVARIVTGLFGGVTGSIGFAIITDLFALEVRGRVMGLVQTAFAGAQVLGLPFGLYLATHFGWHAPFFLIVALGMVVGVILVMFLRPINEHLKTPSDRNPVQHLVKTVTTGRYVRVFLATTLMATGGFMLMPFGSAFSVHNLGIGLDQLPLIYTITGVASIIAGPLVGRLSDKVGRYAVFVAGSSLGMVVVAIYCNLGRTPLSWVILLNIVLFVAIMARMVAAGSLTSAIPAPHDRGAFMAINVSVSQLAGGIAASVAGMIVVQAPDGRILHYDTLGLVVMAAMLATMIMMYPINKAVKVLLAAHAAARGATGAGAAVRPPTPVVAEAPPSERH